MEIKEIKKAGRLTKKTNESEKGSTMKRKNKRDFSQRPTCSNVTSKENRNIL